MIVAVEGPSAAGKTSWCQRHFGDDYVREYSPTGTEPDANDLDTQADYWTSVNSARWLEAARIEAEIGVAVCDSDPLKIHYSWCLARVGAAPVQRWTRELRAVRRAFSAGRLGLADLVLITIPDLATLQAHRDEDGSRRRHSFELHARLREPLREWYQAVDRLDPGRVCWELPKTGLPAGPPPRIDRSDPAQLDTLVRLLPPLNEN